MEWVKLNEMHDDIIWSGFIIRSYLSFSSEFADFLVFTSHEKGCGVGFIYVTGYNAGKIYILLPEESSPEGTRALSRDWLIKNWTKYIDENGDIGRVYIAEGYPASTDPLN